MNNLTGQENEIIRIYGELEARSIISKTEKEVLLNKDFSKVPENKINSYVLMEVAYSRSPNIITQLKTDDIANSDSQKKVEDTFQLNKDLVEIGLVPNDFYAIWEETIKDNKQHASRALMMMVYGFHMSELEKKPERKSHIHELISKYTAGGILPEKFQKEYDKGDLSISHPIELIDYAKQGKVLRLKDFSSDIQIGYSEIYETLNNIFDGLEIKLLEINVKPEPEQNPKHVVANTLLEINKEAYSLQTKLSSK